MGAGTIAQWAKYLLCQHKDLGSIPRTHIKRKLCVVRLDPKPGAEEAERWVPSGLLASQPVPFGELQASETCCLNKCGA